MSSVWLGAMRLVLQVPGAQSLKDSRRVAASLRDRVRHRFDVSVHELDVGESRSRRALIITTGGEDARLIRSTLDQVHALVNSSGDCFLIDVDVELLQWHPGMRDWTADRGAEE